MPRLAAIDVGSNTALLLVADVTEAGVLSVVAEREDITRLGRGVDASGQLAMDRVEHVVATLERFAAEARALGATTIAACATSAVRDASNRDVLVQLARAKAGLTLEVISGEREAELVHRAVVHAFGADAKTPLRAVDIGGGSTEVLTSVGGALRDKRSLDVGSVRLTERFVTSHPIPDEDWRRARALLESELSRVPPPPPGARFVGIAATVTSLASLAHGKPPADVHGALLSRADVSHWAQRLRAVDVSERQRLPYLDPRRAEVLPMGALILETAMRLGSFDACTVTDRGVRYGLLLENA